MKSLSFKKLNISEADVLTKLQMKKIVGGHDQWPACGTGGDICGIIDGVEHKCCTSDRHRVCGADGLCLEP